MTAEQSVAAAADSAPPQRQWLDLAAIVVCTLCWGTTWFAITLQLGVVDPVVSVVYRFAFAAALLFAWRLLRGEKIAMTRAQHVAAFGVGFATFTINYTLVYWAEERVTSAVVAVLFATMAFVNLIGFRIFFRQRSPFVAWAAAALGIAGVAMLAWGEIVQANFGAGAVAGVLLTLAGVLFAVVGNLFARRGEVAGAGVTLSTAWAMAYGAAALALYALATGKTWTVEPSWAYALSFLHLSLNGSVIAFLMYYGLARRRGYATASYVSALAPALAMLMSALFEGKTWGITALGGVALLLSGQFLLLRTRRA
jgi:drug/metabolite transporter (DMT)-like permease